MAQENSLLNFSPEVQVSQEAFPCLTDAHMEQLAAVATRRRYADDEVLWDIGDRRASFHAIISGAVDILQRRVLAGVHQVVRHGPKGFTGDFDLLSDKSAVVEGRAVGETEVLEVAPDDLKQLVVDNSALSDLILGAFIARRQSLIAGGYGNLLLIGSRYSPKTLEIRAFLERNSRPFEWLDLEADESAAALLKGFDVDVDETPVMVNAKGQIIRNPSLEDMAAAMGLSTLAEEKIFDVLVVGAGPAGLAASVYAASEGLSVMALDSVAPGGQASTSSKIENYLGFPTGISGRDLAQRAFVQAEKFGTQIASPRTAVKLDCDTRPYCVSVDDGALVRARTIVIATGAQYRRLPVDGIERFEGKGLHFGATSTEARLCDGQEVIIVGGGNSAGQAAVYLAENAAHVHIMIRGASLQASMSQYLITRIKRSANITLHPHTEITAVDGDQVIERVHACTAGRDAPQIFPCAHVFCFIGAQPNTAWLQDCIALDDRGFVLTGRDVPRDCLATEAWAQRAPFLLETSQPGVFAAGDVRSGSTKRVASGVGEGSICVQFVHAVLAGG